jgi:hypothetical protein
MPSDYTATAGTQAEAFGSQQWGQSHGGSQGYGEQLSPGEAALNLLSDYSRERPEVVAMWAFGIGFLLGWKLKPW